MSGDTTQRAWAASEDLILCGQYHAGVAIARIEVPTRTNEACISRVKDPHQRWRLLIAARDGDAEPQGQPDPLTIWRRLCEASRAERKPRTCLSGGRISSLSAHAVRLCRAATADRHAVETGYAVAGVLKVQA